jgi:hypothetical protein
MANSSLSLVSLDFDGIKNNLKTYMKSQTTFKDYDFEGSNINVLMDILSYNTYMNAFYLNMAVSEGFLDSAQMRSSVVSHAKELNYTPRSIRSAKAVLNLSIVVNSGTTNIIEIPKGTQFSGTNSLGSYVFTTDQTHTISSSSNAFILNGLEIYEGTYINESFTVDNAVTNQKFIMSNKNIDTTSIVVTVIEDNGLNVNNFEQATNLFGLTNISNSYFLQSTLDGYYEVVFGDGAFGRVPHNNATILITYRVSKGNEGNNVKSFRIDKDLGTLNGVVLKTTVTTVNASADGSAEESIDSIKFRAPKHYQTQDRAITNQDYENIIYENFPEVKAVHVYGGETIKVANTAGVTSLAYGKVFISPLSLSGSVLTEFIKLDIQTLLSSRNSIGIKPEIVDPDFLYIIPNISVGVDFTRTSMTPAEIKNLIYTTVYSYNVKYLENFNTSFRFSKLISLLSDSDDSISSIQMNIIAKKISNPTLNATNPFSVHFNNTLIPGTILTGQFLANGGKIYVITDYNPNISTIKRTGDFNTYTVTNTSDVIYLREIVPSNQEIGNYTAIGNVDYVNGIINIGSITVINYMNDPGIVFKASPLSDDLTAYKNDLIEIDLTSMNITVASI